MLKTTLEKHPVITGVDYDIEEECSLNDIRNANERYSPRFSTFYYVICASSK